MSISYCYNVASMLIVLSQCSGYFTDIVSVAGLALFQDYGFEVCHSPIHLSYVPGHDLCSFPSCIHGL